MVVDRSVSCRYAPVLFCSKDNMMNRSLHSYRETKKIKERRIANNEKRKY